MKVWEISCHTRYLVYQVNHLNNAFTRALVTVPARLGSAQHALLCKHNRAALKPCHAGPNSAGLARLLKPCWYSTAWFGLVPSASVKKKNRLRPCPHSADTPNMCEHDGMDGGWNDEVTRLVGRRRCSDKIKKLRQEYKHVKDYNNKLGEEGRLWSLWKRWNPSITLVRVFPVLASLEWLN